MGHAEIVKQLLDNGAEVDAPREVIHISSVYRPVFQWG